MPDKSHTNESGRRFIAEIFAYLVNCLASKPCFKNQRALFRRFGKSPSSANSRADLACGTHEPLFPAAAFVGV